MEKMEKKFILEGFVRDTKEEVINLEESKGQSKGVFYIKKEDLGKDRVAVFAENEANHKVIFAFTGVELSHLRLDFIEEMVKKDIDLSDNFYNEEHTIISFDGFDDEKINSLIYALRNEVKKEDLRKIAKPLYTEKQLQLLVDGCQNKFCEKSFYQAYANPLFNERQMRIILKTFQEGFNGNLIADYDIPFYQLEDLYEMFTLGLSEDFIKDFATPDCKIGVVEKINDFFYDYVDMENPKNPKNPKKLRDIILENFEDEKIQKKLLDYCKIN